METLPSQIYNDIKGLIPELSKTLNVTTDRVLEVGARYVYSDILLNLFCLIILIVAAIGLWKLFLLIKSKEEGDDLDMDFILCVVAPLALIIFIIVVILALPEIITNIVRGLFVPEIRLFELFAHLITKK